jgi:hypothetical protein
MCSGCKRAAHGFLLSTDCGNITVRTSATTVGYADRNSVIDRAEATGHEAVTPKEMLGVWRTGLTTDRTCTWPGAARNLPAHYLLRECGKAAATTSDPQVFGTVFPRDALGRVKRPQLLEYEWGQRLLGVGRTASSRPFVGAASHAP